MTEPTPIWVAGRAEHGVIPCEVRNPYHGGVIGQTSLASAEQVERAVCAAQAAVSAAVRLPAAVRAAALDHVSRALQRRAEEAAAMISAESGKPISWARTEAARAAATFRWAAEEARRFSGDLMRLDTDAASTGRMALVRRFPKGPVLGITPFNFPMNLVAHKVAPALAVGTPIVVKPAPATPLSALLLGELLAETDLPDGIFSVLPLKNDAAGQLVVDPRLPVVSFTGSGRVGGWIGRAAPEKHVTLELGGNAAAVVCGDYRDLRWAAARIALFGNYQAGQSCIAVQRVIVHRAVAAEFVPILVAQVRGLITGDPADVATQVGPLIDEPAAERVCAWVDEAVAAGAELLCGGTRDGTTVAPTVLAKVPADAKVACEEVFGPVLVVSVVDSDDDAFAAVNTSAYGLQTGVFTTEIRTAFAAYAALRVGGVVTGDVPSYRAEQMPYGGVKASGVGREGVRSAMEDFTDPRVLVLTGIDV